MLQNQIGKNVVRLDGFIANKQVMYRNIYEHLCKIANNFGINVVYLRFPEGLGGLRGLYVKYANERPIIVINNKLNIIKRTETFAHELAHYFLGHGWKFSEHEDEKCSKHIREAETEAQMLALKLIELLRGGEGKRLKEYFSCAAMWK
ncbi:MAG: hypothetical protein A4E53_03374 [Pelotomaculum sp. PtaB.Bin104]|nr:MAG: hypothetical protein A4E53_03374 [Pelotomaculum sp. PtaB.Bin104]